jgi:hypothetical protein
VRICLVQSKELPEHVVRLALFEHLWLGPMILQPVLRADGLFPTSVVSLYSQAGGAHRASS